MKPLFFPYPITMPRPLPRAMNGDEVLRRDLAQLCRRAAELMRAAALVDGTQPGLLLPEDFAEARRRGLAAARRVLPGSESGKPQIAYFRTLTGAGLRAAEETVPALAARVWLLEDRCGLADGYLRAVVDAALQQGAACILCPSPLHRDRLEAVFLPGAGAAFLSRGTVGKGQHSGERLVHLDRIPNAERRRDLRLTIQEDRRIAGRLIVKAAQTLAAAEILRDLADDPCTLHDKRI